MSVPTPAELGARLRVDETSANNIHNLLRLAFARGQSGRWPEQRFEEAADWATDGHLVDRIAHLAGLDAQPVLEMYALAHASGLRAR